MKRGIIGIVIGLIIFFGLGIFFWLGTEKRIAASQIAPAHSLFYAELPDIQETIKRWPQTALSQILNEPSMRRFVKQPLSKIPSDSLAAWDSFVRLRCSGLFVCVADSYRDNWIVGIRTPVDRSVSRIEIGLIARNLFGCTIRELDSRMAGAGSETEDKLLLIQVGDWLVLGRNAGLLQETARNANTGSGGIQSDRLFQECRSKVLANYDLLSFVRGGPIFDISNGLSWVLPKDEREGDIKAILSTTTIDGPRLHDSVFTRQDIPSTSGPFEQHDLDMSSPKTIAFFTSRVGLSELWRITDQFSQFSQVAETIHDYLDQARSFGIDPRDLDALISGATVIIDCDAKTDVVTAALSFRVNDPEKFKHLIDEIVTQKFSDNCVQTHVSGVPAYVVQGNANAAVVFGLTGHEFLVACNASVFAEVLKRMQTKEDGLQKNEDYKRVTKLVAEPTDMFMYIDTKTTFERFYDAIRPMLIFGTVFVPTLGVYVDSSLLPETDEISKHLTPIVFSKRRVPNGILDESVGAVTAYQASGLVLGTTVALGLCYDAANFSRLAQRLPRGLLSSREDRVSRLQHGLFLQHCYECAHGGRLTPCAALNQADRTPYVR